MAAPRYIYVDDYYATEGLTSNGQEITNIFAFDCTGQPLDGVQLFDQNGQPLTTLRGEGGANAEPLWRYDEASGHSIIYKRNALADYATMWNVFPLQEARGTDYRDPSEVPAKDAVWPFSQTLPSSPQCVVAGEGSEGGESGEGAASADGADGASTTGATAAKP